MLGAACGGDDGGTYEGPAQGVLPELPGTAVPTQGRGHFNYTFDPARDPTPFCDGVAWSGDPTGAPAVLTDPPPEGCYNSNPPTSGEHLGVQRNVEVKPGATINIPPDPDVYPPDIKIPREAIPHILEHAGIYVAYNCAEGDAACEDVVEQLIDLTNDRIDNHDDRVVLARDTDLVPGTIAIVSWTRIDSFRNADFTVDRVEEFIEAHACRFDPEGFCG
jgi:hypothetical protein